MPFGQPSLIWNLSHLTISSTQKRLLAPAVRCYSSRSALVTRCSVAPEEPIDQTALIIEELKGIKKILADVASSQGSIKKTLGTMARTEGVVAEILVIQNLPPALKGCRRVELALDADLDRLFGRGSAAAVVRTLCGDAQQRILVVRRLLHAVAFELQNAKVVDTKEAQEAQEIKEQMHQWSLNASTAAGNPELSIPEARMILQGARKLLQSVNVLGKSGSARWDAAFKLLKRIHSMDTPPAHSVGVDDLKSSEALLALFLMTGGLAGGGPAHQAMAAAAGACGW